MRRSPTGHPSAAAARGISWWATRWGYLNLKPERTKHLLQADGGASPPPRHHHHDEPPGAFNCRSPARRSPKCLVDRFVVETDVRTISLRFHNKSVRSN